MNLCRDCNSEYEKPGTCNCFAQGGKRYAAYVPPSGYPWHPWPWTYYPYPQTTPYITWTVGDAPAVTITGNTIPVASGYVGITSNFVSIAEATAAWDASHAGGKC